MRFVVNFLSFLVSLSITLYLTWQLNNPFKLGDTYIPPIGKLFDPFAGFWQNAEPLDFSPYHSVVTAGLQTDASVVYDQRMVPHLFAGSEVDMAYMQGYVSAQHRLWQMDFSARAAAGRLSEVLGERTAEYDLQRRRIGMAWAAEGMVENWKKDPERLAQLQAYAAGVNAYIDSLQYKDYPLEYKILDYKPEHWSPLKTALVLKAMAFNLCSHEEDLEASNAYALFGKDTFDYLFPEYFPEQSPIIPSGTKWDFKPLQAVAENQSQGFLQFKPTQKANKHDGSNNWAVSPEKTAAGRAILCGDPHLNLTLPSVWLEMQLNSPEKNVYGVSLPGVPGIIIGFNENVAWTMTNVGHDVSDWYAIKWADKDKKRYLLDGQAKPAALRVETVKIKNKADLVDTVRYTQWGPVAFLAKQNDRMDMALRWIAHDADFGNEIAVIAKLNTAKNYDDYIDALKGYSNPAQNFAFASKAGDIAIKVNGRLPIKRREQGRFVQDGTKSSNAWQGFIPSDQLPLSKNPQRGFVSSANQQSTDPTYPYYYNSENFEEYRGRILNRKLENMSNDITPKDMMALQYSSYNLQAEEMLPLLLQMLDAKQLSPEEELYATKLKIWDYNYNRNEFAPVIYENWYNEFYNMIWDEMDSTGIVLKPTDFRTFALLRDAPNDPFFDVKATTSRETAKDIVNQSFKKAYKLTSEWAAQQQSPNLGQFKASLVGHLGRMEGFSRSLDANGCMSALNAMGKQHGPSWRMVVELDDKPRAWVTYPGGTSGNPGSPFYDNFLHRWQEGEYYEALFLYSPNGKQEKQRFVQNFIKK